MVPVKVQVLLLVFVIKVGAVVPSMIAPVILLPAEVPSRFNVRVFVALPLEFITPPIIKSAVVGFNVVMTGLAVPDVILNKLTVILGEPVVMPAPLTIFH